MRIILDLDDTQSNFCENWISRYNEITGDNVQPKDVKGWDIQNYCNKCSKEELYAILDEDGFFRNIKPVKGARRVIARLRGAGHEVITVTATYNPVACVDKSWWLDYYMGFKQEDIVFCIKKELIKGDLLLDDGEHNHEKFDGIKVVYDRPHNQHMREYQYDVRVKDWNQFEIYLEMNNILPRT